jgi:hypothetical protein
MASGTRPNAQPRAADTRRIDSAGCARSSLALRSGTLIFRTSSLKISLDDQLPDLGVQLLDLAVPARLRVLARPTPIKGPGSLLQQLLLQA